MAVGDDIEAEIFQLRDRGAIGRGIIADESRRIRQSIFIGEERVAGEEDIFVEIHGASGSVTRGVNYVHGLTVEVHFTQAVQVVQLAYWRSFRRIFGGHAGYESF